MTHDKLITEKDQYESYYRFPVSRAPCITGEKSVSYLYREWCDRVISNIHRLHPLGRKLKIIMILRQPADRMYSQYLFNTRVNERLTFIQAIKSWVSRKERNWVPAYDYIGAGFYAVPVRSFLDHFDDVKIFLFEDLRDHPDLLLEELYHFLGVESGFRPESLGTAYNFSGLPNRNLFGRIYGQKWIRRSFRPLRRTFPNGRLNELLAPWLRRVLEKPELDRDLRQEITGWYRDDIKELESITGRDLSHWIR